MSNGDDVPSANQAEYVEQVVARIVAPGFARWYSQVRSTGFCARPIRIRGRTVRLDRETGQAVSRYASREEPDGAVLVACKDRRRSVCPTCAATYREDMYQLIAAGLGGGKGLPASVADHPAVFATLTAPTFGAVHSPRQGSDRRPRVCHKQAGTCRHGRPRGCPIRHRPSDPTVGSPMCPPCYRYADAVLWNYQAPELWRRTTIDLHRTLGRLLGMSRSELARQVRLSFTKVAEPQARGLIHFHAVIRVDAAQPDPDGHPAPPPAQFTAEALAVAVRVAAGDVAAPNLIPAAGPVRWGAQVDVRVIGASPAHRHTKVAGYLAKYATKTIGEAPAATSEHYTRMAATCHAIAKTTPALRDLAGAAGTLGFKGRIGTRSRAYSTTLTQLRAARADYRLREAGHNPAATLPVGQWAYAGRGYLNAGDASFAQAGSDNRIAGLIATAEERINRRHATRPSTQGPTHHPEARS